jgi:hypothetical protein
LRAKGRGEEAANQAGRRPGEARAAIYYLDAQSKVRRIPDEELAVGMLEGGARVFRTRSGKAYESLSMLRGDMSDAITVLRNARGALHGAGEARAAVRKT